MPIKALLYSVDAADQEPSLAGLVVAQLNARQLLWIDLISPTAGEVAQVSGLLGCEPGLLAVDDRPDTRPRLANYGSWFRLTANAATLDEVSNRVVSQPITLLAGPNYVVSIHREGMDFVDELRDREKGDSAIGSLSSESFVASLLDWLLNSYFHVLEAVVHEIDAAEIAILGKRVTRVAPQLLEVLVRGRRRIAELRRLLIAHRDVFYGLARPDFVATEQPEAKPHFEALNKHMERAEDDLDHARDLVIGSFELLSMRAAQRTNDTVRALTFATVLMGTLALVAGIMGMNFELEFFRRGLDGFLIVTGSMVLLAVLSLWVAFRRSWI